MTSEPDPGVVRAAKRLLPRPAKEVVGGVLRGAGMVTSPLRTSPTYLLVGAKRCGSTSLHRYLLEHPQVAPLFPAAQHKKGTHWFDRHYDRSPAWYRSHFPLRAGGKVGGESSTYYFSHPHSPSRAAEHVPDAKIIALLREPVGRAYSQYRDEVKNGNESLSFAEALAAEPGRTALEHERMRAEPGYHSFVHEHLAYREWGQYAEHLARWREFFPAEQMLVLRSEDMFARPPEVYRQVTDFLGLRPAGARFEQHNATHGELPDDPAVDELREHYVPHNAALSDLLPGFPAW